MDGASVGKTSLKYVAEDALVEFLLFICSTLYVFARKQNIAEIKERVYTTESGLRRMRDTELALFGNAVAELAGANAKDIAAFGMSADKIACLRKQKPSHTTRLSARGKAV